MDKTKFDISKLFYLLVNHFYSDFEKYLKMADFDINYRDDQENYLITYAIRFNKKDIVQKLLDKGASYDIVDKNGRSIVYDAIESNFIQIVEILLEHSNQAVGVSIEDIKDSNKNIPLHYAIKFKNINMIKLLLNRSKTHEIDESGYNALHMAVKTINLDIVKLIVSNTLDLDIKTKHGETALHIAINYQYTDIAIYLIELGANPNIEDDEAHFTPLHYATGWNNVSVIKSLIKHGAKLDSQDIYGNIPLIYSIKEMHNTFNLLYNSNLNINLWNIDGKIVLHEILDMYSDNSIEKDILDKYIDIVIEDSNLTIQDVYGNTCLHYLIHHKIWLKYKDVLVKKKLNIFALNSDSLMPIDLINKNQESILLDITTKSYIYRLNKEENWTDEIDKMCSREIIDLTDDQKLDISKKSKESCYSIIYDRLETTLKQIRSNELVCCQRSYPSRVEDVDIKEGIALDMTTFTGSLLDILFGLIHLLSNHSNCCAILSMDSTNSKTLCNFYRSMGLIMGGKCEFLNFEIVWIEFKLYIMDNFLELWKQCIKSNKRFIIVPLGIEMKYGSHANYLIYDNSIKEIERFEPHGGTTPIGFNYNSTQLDDLLEKYFVSIDKDIRYVRPHEFIPKIGFQIMEAHEAKTHKIGDPGGFCALWSIWYVDQRLSTPRLSREKLIDDLFSDIRLKRMSYRNLIRNYSRNIVQKRDRILNKAGLDINDWLNENYSNNTLDNVLSLLTKEIQELQKF